MVFVFLRKKNILLWNTPVYADCRVIPRNGTLYLWRIEVVALVLENSSLALYNKTMSKTARNKELAVVLGCKLYGDILAECW